MPSPRLSKSRFMAGCQCALKLWHDLYSKDLWEEPDEATQAIFDQGHQVGELAQRRYPGGVLIEADYRHPQQALEQTRAALSDMLLPALFEAAFEHGGVLARADILARAGRKWDLLEVKSSSKPKDHFVTDVAVQYWIATKAGLPIHRAGLLLLNRGYVYDGKKLDLEALFKVHDLTAECQARLDEIGAKVAELQEMLAAKAAPEIEPGPQCSDPYDCPYWDHCTKDLTFPEHPVTSLYGGQGKWRARDQVIAAGIREIQEIPEDFPLSAIHARQRACVITGEPWASTELAELLQDVAYPLHYLDFETINPAIPRFCGTSPFDQVPFQFSIHTQEAPGGQITHGEYLCTHTGDPREELARGLLEALGKKGSIVHYSHFEGTVIGNLAGWLPPLKKPLQALLGRCLDLLQIVRDHYYHPEFKGSFSIKTVLPVLVPQMSYEGMEVADGGMAGVAWMRMLQTDDPDERARLEAALRAYCLQDTLAMVRVREVLGGKGGEGR